MGGLKSGQLRTGLLQDGLKTGKLRSGLRNVSTWAPSQIDSLAHWYDATEISGSDGDAIGTWADQEGTDDLTQGTTANKPTLRTNGINSNNILEHDGSDDYLSNSYTTLSQPNEIFVVAKWRDVSSISNEYVFGYTDANNRNDILAADTSNWGYFDGSTVVSGNGAGAPDTNPHIFDHLANGASSYLEVDGVQAASGDGGADGQAGISTGSIQGGNAAPVDIGEILFYDADLSSSDKSDVESYLSDKWGITI